MDEAWAREMKPPYSGEVSDIELTIGFSIDSSESMTWNDPDDIRKQTAKEFVDKLDQNDKAAVVDFDATAKVNCPLTSNKTVIKNAIDQIDSYGSTSLTAGMTASLNQLENSQSTAKYVIMLTDGQGVYDQSLTQRAINQGIVVYTIGLGSEVDEPLLRGIAEATGGKYYFAEQASDLSGIFEETSEETIDLTKDSDKDGLSDYHEKNGMKMSVGAQPLKTDPFNRDTDNDGLMDGQEIEYNNGCFKFKTDPTNADTDGDGFGDKGDGNPNIWDISDRDLLMCSKLVYKDWKKGDMVNESELKYGWTVYDTYSSISGISCTAFKKDDNIIFAYRGSELGDVGKIVTDWVVADGIGYITGMNAQVPEAKIFMISVMTQNPGCTIYETGHSLGGYLAKKAAAVSILLFKDSFNKVATFNGLGFALNIVTLGLNSPDIALLGSVDASKVVSYEINGDLVSLIGIEPGKVIPLNRSQKLIDSKKLTDDPAGWHDLLNFYEYINPIRSKN